MFEEQVEERTNWTPRNILLSILMLGVLVAVPRIYNVCRLDPVAWIRGDRTLCAEEVSINEGRREGHISAQYRGSSGGKDDNLEVFASEGETIEFTYSASLLEGAIDITFYERKRGLRGGIESVWSSGRMASSRTESVTLAATTSQGYFFVVDTDSSTRGSLDLSWTAR